VDYVDLLRPSYLHGCQISLDFKLMIRKWIKGIVKEALAEWEQEVEYLGRTGYKWENNEWVPTQVQPLRLDEIQE